MLSANAVFALALCGLSAILVWLQVRASKRSGDAEMEELDRRFLRIQHRRRMQAALMFGLVGLAMFCEPLVAGSVGKVTLWTVIVLVVLWIVLLAAADAVHSQMHYARLHGKQIQQQAKLHAEIARKARRDGRRNGHARPELGKSSPKAP